MVQGFVVDKGHHDWTRVSTWTEGAPQLGWWGGVKSPERERLHPIGAMRCSGCGFLEFYARAEFRPS